MQEKGELQDTERAYLLRAQQIGLDTNAILKRRPDWAPDVGQSYEQALAKIAPLEFRQNVQPEAFRNPEVVVRFMLDEAKFREISQRGKTSVKREILDTLNNPAHTIPPALMPRLTELINRADQINSSPNWKV